MPRPHYLWKHQYQLEIRLRMQTSHTQEIFSKSTIAQGKGYFAY